MNETKTNTTTRPAAVLLLVEDNRAAHHTRRNEAAHARHAVSTAGVWTDTPQGIRPPIHRQTAEQLTTTADTAARLAIRARHQAAATDIFRQLTNSRRSDNITRTFPAIAAEAMQAEQERDKYRKAAEQYRAIADRKTATPAEKKAARAKAKAATKAADKAAAKADSLNRLLDTTASDRADIVQAAAFAALTHDHAADPNGAFAAMCRAAGQAIAAIAAPTALNATRTKVNEITDEQAAALLKAYPPIISIDPATGYEIATPCHIPHNVKGATSQCFDTIEQRERGRGKDRRRVWCRVSHYLTVAPCVSYEQYTENGERAEIATNGGINAIGTQEDRAAIVDLLERANLTEREAAIVYRVADQTAAHHGQAAANEYWRERTPQIAALPTKKARREAHKAAQATADRYRIAAQWENAFDRSGVYSKGNRYTVKSRIYARLTAATKPAEPMTEAERAEADRRQWEREQRNSRRAYAPAQTPAPDLIAGASRAAATLPKHKPVILWVESGNTPQASGTDYRAAEVEQRAAEQAAAAKRHRQRAADLAEITAEARRASGQFAAEWRARPAHIITAAEWNAIPAAARIAYLEQIHAEGKRLDFVKA